MRPVFLVAARRSGTTLLRLMLDGHPDVRWFRGWEPVASAIETLVRTGAAPMQLGVEGLGQVTADSVAGLREEIDRRMRDLLSEDGASVFGATVHVGFRSLTRAWPKARFIHLVRDPRDIAISNLKLGWSGHAFEAANTWVAAERDWDRMVPHLESGQHMGISYENLVADPVAELGRVSEFLNIPFDDDLFSYTKTSSYSYPKPELAQRWRGRLDQRELQLIEHGLQETMVSRGYEPATDHVQFSAPRKFCFRQIGKWKLRRNAMKRYGIGHLLLRKSASVLGSDALNRRVERKEQQMRDRHIRDLEKNY